MDAKKLEKLKEVGFKILPICGLCIHGSFPKNGGVHTEWGTCELHNYDHQKHTGPARDMSIHFAGTCPDFQWTSNGSLRLKHYVQFISETES